MLVSEIEWVDNALKLLGANSGAMARTAYSDKESWPASFVARFGIYKKGVNRGHRKLQTPPTHLFDRINHIGSSHVRNRSPDANLIGVDKVPRSLLNRNVV